MSITADRAALHEEVRALRQDVDASALPGLALAYVGVALGLAAPLVVDAWWVPLVVALPVGLLQYRIVISGHEAVHKTLCAPEWLNEALGVVGQALVGVSFASYRVQHLEHHKAASEREDPDAHIWHAVVRESPGWRRLAVLVLGMPVEIAVKIAQKSVGSLGTARRERVGDGSVAASHRHSAYVLLAQAALFLLCFAITGRITGYLEQWLLPLFGVAVSVNRVRLTVEHGLAWLERDAAERRLPTLDLSPNAVERWIFAPFSFHRHASHHLHPAVPARHLDRLHALLEAHGQSGYRSLPIGYTRAVWRVLTEEARA